MEGGTGVPPVSDWPIHLQTSSQGNKRVERDFNVRIPNSATRRDLLLRYAPVALPGQTFVFPNISMRYRAGFVRSGSTPKDTKFFASQKMLPDRDKKGAQASRLCIH
jgi:hypothetical protein